MVCFWQILLKKSPLVTTAKKLAFEIEILKSGRGLRAQISRSYAQKKRFHRSRVGRLGKATFSTESAVLCRSLLWQYTMAVHRYGHSGPAHLGVNSKFSSMVDTIIDISPPSCSSFSQIVPYISLNARGQKCCTDIPKDLCGYAKARYPARPQSLCSSRFLQLR